MNTSFDTIKDKIKEIFDFLNNVDTEYYKELELAILIFLRGDEGTFDTLDESVLDNLLEITDKYSSLLDLDKDMVDAILDGEDFLEEDLEEE